MPPVRLLPSHAIAGAMLVLGVIAAPGLPRAFGQQPPAGAVPVTVAPANKADLPIYVRGIGTVAAWRTVQVRAQVTGYLQSIDFREGEDVKRGQLLAMIDPRPYAAALAEAQARQAGDQATLANDELNYQRDSQLAKSDFASRQQVDNDAAQVRLFQANVQADEAAIAAAQLNLEFCRITAPIDGTAGFRLVDIGNLVQANGTQAIVTLQQVQPIAVVFTLSQSLLPQVRKALAAGRPEVIADTPGGGRRLAVGTLLTPNNSIDSTTGTISLKALFANADRALWPGQFVDAALELRLDRGAVTVPLVAVQHGPDRLYVFIVRPNGTVADTPVSVGYQDDHIAEITSGLAGGERVVTDGQARLQNGSRVVVRPAAQAS